MSQFLRTLAVLAAVATGIAVLARTGLFDGASVSGVRSWIGAWGPLGPAVFVGITVVAFLVPGPDAIFVALGGALFGAWRGFAYSWAAIVIGTALPFLLVRMSIGTAWSSSERSWVERLRRIDDRLSRNGFVMVALLRLVLYLAPPLNWALGATRVRIRDYVLGTAVGVVPATAATAHLASAVASPGEPGWPALLPAALLAALLIVGAMLGRGLFGRGSGFGSRGSGSRGR